MSEKFCLRWNDFESNISSAFREIRNERDFFDVTLACDDDQTISAHKVIISACSPLFRSMLKRSKHEHPLVYMRGVRYSDLISVLDFMYHGEVSVAQEELNSFLSVAEELKVKGLTQKNESHGERKRNTQESDPKRYKEQAKTSIPIPKTSNSQQQHLQQQEDDIQEIAHVKTEPPIVAEADVGGGAIVQEEEYDQIYDGEFADPEYGYDHDQSLIAAADDENKDLKKKWEGDYENNTIKGEYFEMDVVKEEILKEPIYQRNSKTVKQSVPEETKDLHPTFKGTNNSVVYQNQITRRTGGRKLTQEFKYTCQWCSQETLMKLNRGRFREIKNYRDHFRNKHPDIPFTEFLEKVERDDPKWQCKVCKQQMSLPNKLRHQIICKPQNPALLDY